MHTGWLGHQFTGWTNRDVLLACAFSLPAAVQALNKDDTTAANPTVEIVGELCALCSEDVLEQVGYGLSPALLQQLAVSIGEILTHESSNSAWRQARELMDREDYDDELASILSSLERLPIDARRFRSAFGTGALSAATVLQGRKVHNWAATHEHEATVVGWEIASRLRRLDFPVIDRETPIEVILGADVKLIWNSNVDHVTVKLKGANVAERLGNQSWHVADDSFHAGLEAGRKAAVQLLRECGIPVQTLSVVFEQRGSLPPAAPIHDASAGLPLALHILAEKSGFSTFGYIPTGSIDPNTLLLEPLAMRDIEAKHRAMITDGVNHTLLAYAPDAASGRPPLEGLKLAEGATLHDAARALWGAAWEQWVDTNSRARLKEFGFDRGWLEGLWPSPLTINGETVIVPMRQVEELLERFRTRRKTAFLGGPPQSGKTWIAQQLEVRAHEQQWTTIVLNPRPDTRLTQDNLTAAISLHLRSADLRPVLVIIDNIEWDERLEAFEEQLGSVAEKLDVNILAIMRSDDETGWKTNEGLAPVVGIRRMRDFVEQLVNHDAFGEARKRLAPLAGKIAEGGDLAWVVRLAKLAYEGGEFAPTVQQFIKPRLEHLTTAERQSARALAALSYVGLDAPDWFVNDPEPLRSLGARERGVRRWFLPSRTIAIGLLTHEARRARDEAAQILSRFVVEAISRDDVEVTRVLVRLSAESPDTLAMICRDRRSALDRWMETVVRPEHLGRALHAIKEHIQPVDRGKWAHRLVRLLSGDLKNCRAADLALILDLLQSHQPFIERLEDGSSAWSKLMGQLQIDLPAVIARERSPLPRLELLRGLWRLHDPATYAAIIANADGFLTFHQPYAFEDYKLALEFVEISRKLPAPLNLFRLDGVESLIDTDASETSPDVYAAQLVLRSASERLDWGTNLFPVTVPELARLLAKGTPRQICNTVSILGKFDRALASGLFNAHNGRLAGALIASIGRFTSAGEMATLLDLTSHAHFETARRLLYEDSRGPTSVRMMVRQSTMNIAYRSITSRGDGKGAGRLIRAAFNVDSSFASIEEGFARKLTARLGKVFFLNQCEWEPRTSVLYHMIEGLVAVDAPFLADIIDAAVEAIVRQIQTSKRPWAPRLALLLADASSVGQTISTALSGSISAQRLLECMQDAPNVESLELFHRLGSYLHQQSIPREFVTSFRSEPTALYEKLNRAERPEQVIRAARTVSQTLRRGGGVDSGNDALEGVHRNWARWLKTARTDGDLAECIRGLAELDMELAQHTVAKIERHLADRVQDAIRRQPQVGVELLDSIESAAPGTGRTLIEHLRRAPRTWTATMQQIAHLQDPREQGTIFSMLAGLGAFPDANQINNVFGRWRASIATITSPPALVVLLRALAAWDWHRTTSLAHNLPIDRITSRLRAGAKHDLDWVEALVGALRNLECFSAADSVLDSLAVLQPQRLVAVLDAERLARLLIGLKTWRPTFGERLISEAAELPQRTSNNRYVGDDSSLVLNLGWLGYATCEYDQFVDLGEDIPWIYQVPQAPGKLVWGLGWFAKRAWSDALVRQSMAVIHDSTAVDATVAAATLVVGIRRQYDIDIPFLMRSVHDSTSLYLIEALVETAAAHSLVTAPLLVSLPTAGMHAPHMRLHPARERILKRLAKLQTHPSVSAPLHGIEQRSP